MNTNLEDILDKMGEGEATEERYKTAIKKALDEGFGMIMVGDLRPGYLVAYVTTDPFMGDPLGDIQFVRVGRIEDGPYGQLRVHHHGTGDWTDAYDFENVLALKN